MIDRIANRREGQIAVAASAIYALAGTIATYYPSLLPLREFYRWFCLFMPLPLLLFYIQIGGFRKHYTSSLFNTAIIVIAALMPVISWVYARATH